MSESSIPGTAKSAESALPHLLSRVAMVCGAAVLAIALGMAGWAGYLKATGNIHTVIAGQFYRSAELSKVGFKQVIARFHIATIVSLRGANPGKPWYKNELAASQAMGVQHIDVRMSATHLPSVQTLREIRAVLAQAKRPILIHCAGGADRSGLVAALAELWIAHLPPALAGAQLSFDYGHFPWLESRTVAMDEAWHRVLKAQQRH